MHTTDQGTYTQTQNKHIYRPEDTSESNGGVGNLKGARDCDSLEAYELRDPYRDSLFLRDAAEECVHADAAEVCVCADKYNAPPIDPSLDAYDDSFAVLLASLADAVSNEAAWRSALASCASPMLTI